MSQTRIRVLIAKPGLDGHDRGAKVVARALRDAGMEVIYTGLHQTPEMVVGAAIQEGVDAIGLSIMSGAHGHLVPEITRLLKAQGAQDIPVLLGGIIPEEDFQAMKEAGVTDIMTPGTPLATIVQKFQAAATRPQPEGV
jgi:methylmalonyl-CoA mutase C-terminal domain/subunit